MMIVMLCNCNVDFHHNNQAAFSLYNYLIGYIMFYVRSPRDQGENMIGSALSLLWMVVHSVQGIGLKDLKQILRKEQVL